MKKYGEAAVVEMVIQQLPEIMGAVSKPMEQIDHITVIDNGGSEGASKVAKTVSDVASNGFYRAEGSDRCGYCSDDEELCGESRWRFFGREVISGKSKRRRMRNFLRRFFFYRKI